MAGIESVLIGTGRAVASRAAASWLGARRAISTANSQLHDQVELTWFDKYQKRDLDRQIARIGDQIAKRLEKVCANEYVALPANEKLAALEALQATFSEADLSDGLLLDIDADPQAFASAIRAAYPSAAREAGLNEAAESLYDNLLLEASASYLRLIVHLPPFQARASVEMLHRLSAIADELASVLARMPLLSTNSNAPEQDVVFRRRYLEAISSTQDELEVFGVELRRHHARTNLSVAYVGLSAMIDEDDKVGRKVTKTDRSRLERNVAAAEAGPVPVEAVLGHSARTLIRGEAGSGKTTLLRWLAVRAARGELDGALAAWNGVTPFIVKLRAFASALPSPPQFLGASGESVREYMPEGWVDRELSAGRALLLIDGVDELPARRRKAARTWIRALLSQYADVKIVITSRPYSATSDWLAPEGFRSVILDKMSPSSVRAFVHHWHSGFIRAGTPATARDLDKHRDALLGRLASHPHLQALATSPLLCAMLCALNLDRSTFLPRNRMSLYDAALELLLERRDLERGIEEAREFPLDAEEKLLVLQSIAWTLLLNGRTEVSKTEAVRRISTKLSTMPNASIGAEEVLAYLIQRSGVIREPSAGSIDFIHKTFQEYLAAKEVTDEGDLGFLVERAHLQTWRETVVMAAGHATSLQRRELVTEMLRRATAERRPARQLKLVTGACLETMSSLPAGTYGIIESALGTIVPPRTIEEARSLASVGEHIVKAFPDTLEGVSEAAAAASIRTLAYVGGSRALDLLEVYARPERRRRPVAELVLAWQYFEREDYAQRVLAELHLYNGSATISDLALIPYLRILQNLRSLHISQATSENIDSLAEAPALRSVEVEASGVLSLAPLKKQKGLRELIVRARRVSGLAALEALPSLRDLGLYVEAGIRSIPFLRPGSSLESFNLSSDLVAEPDQIAGNETLKEFSVGKFPELRSFRQILPLPALERFSADIPNLDGDITSLLEASPRLHDLEVRDCSRLTDLSSLAGRSFRRLSFMGCRNLVDCSPLASVGGLQYLTLMQTAVNDLSFLREMKFLTWLDIDECRYIDKLDSLSALSKLQHLWMSELSVSSLEPLTALPSLSFLRIMDCPNIDNLEPLARVPGLKEIDVQFSATAFDFTPLAHLNLTISKSIRQELIGEESFGPGIKVIAR